jgi:hypothetical protein
VVPLNRLSSATSATINLSTSHTTTNQGLGEIGAQNRLSLGPLLASFGARRRTHSTSGSFLMFANVASGIKAHQSLSHSMQLARALFSFLEKST